MTLSTLQIWLLNQETERELGDRGPSYSLGEVLWSQLGGKGRLIWIFLLTS